MKLAVGMARIPDDGVGETMRVKGRDLRAGVPREIEVTQADIAASLSDLIGQIVETVLTALEKTGWHRGKTAELLGISPSTLYRRLREYGLETR